MTLGSDPRGDEPLYMPGRHLLTAREERVVSDAADRAPRLADADQGRLVFRDDRLEVWADKDHEPHDPHASHDGHDSRDSHDGRHDATSARQTAVACGAVTYNACLAVRSLGHEAWVQVRPQLHMRRLAAVIHIGVRRSVAHGDQELYDAIAGRQVTRGPYRDWRLPFALITRLEESAEAEGAYFRTLTSTETERMRGLGFATEQGEVGDAESDSARVVAAIVSPRRSGDDVLTELADEGADNSDPGAVAAPEQRPTLALLSTPGDSHKDWVRTGMALEHVLLTAFLHGVVASFLTAPIGLLAERAQLVRAAVGIDHPQLVMRLGYPLGGLTRTARRDADAMASVGRPGR